MNPLIDGFGRRHTYLRIAVTDRCNLRCTYCMPPEGIPWRPPAEILRFEEIERLVGILARLGVRKVRLTGGEPTVRQGIEDLVARLAGVPGIETLAMTTNGVLLARKADALRASGLTALNVSLDTLRPERFEQITRRTRLADVLSGIEAALAAGFAPLKVNVVVMRGVNGDELLDFVALAGERALNVRFIEYMPFSGNGWDAGRFLPAQAMRERIAARYSLRALDEGSPGAQVAKDYLLGGGPGIVSFITPLSEEFCGTCSRLRLTADGCIRTCLFAPAEVSLRDALRSGATDDALADLIARALWRKPAGHHALGETAGSGRAMVQIGG